MQRWATFSSAFSKRRLRRDAVALASVRARSDLSHLSVIAGAGCLAHVRRVRVGTANPPKLEAVRLAFGSYSSDVEVEGAPVESGVPEQPLGFAEIIEGARNRARRAAETGDCELAVGIEDGLVTLPGVVGGPVLNLGCAIVSDGEREGLGFSSGFGYPPDCVAPAVKDRTPIGGLFDAYWQARRGASAAPASPPSALSSGNVGKLSLGVLNRSEYARHAVLCALVSFLNPDLYPPSLVPGEAAVESLR